MSLIKFLASTTGRRVRIVAGIALIAVGLLALQNVTGIILAVRLLLGWLNVSA